MASTHEPHTLLSVSPAPAASTAQISLPSDKHSTPAPGLNGFPDDLLRSTFESFLIDSPASPAPAALDASKLGAIWRLIDPRKPNRHRRLLERTKAKLESTTSKQVNQILLLNSLLDTLTNYNDTLSRFQANSLSLHRCLIKWDRLKARDQSFSRTSLSISLDLQNFMTRIHEYYPATWVALTPADDDDEAEEEIGIGSVIDQNPENQVTTSVSSSSSSRPSKKITLKTHILIRYRLHRLRSCAKKFNREFRAHENSKMVLKLRGNQCIFDMVKDGKVLLKINEDLVGVVLDLVLLSRKF